MVQWSCLRAGDADDLSPVVQRLNDFRSGRVLIHTRSNCGPVPPVQSGRASGGVCGSVHGSVAEAFFEFARGAEHTHCRCPRGQPWAVGRVGVLFFPWGGPPPTKCMVHRCEIRYRLHTASVSEISESRKKQSGSRRTAKVFEENPELLDDLHTKIYFSTGRL